MLFFNGFTLIKRCIYATKSLYCSILITHKYLIMSAVQTAEANKNGKATTKQVAAIAKKAQTSKSAKAPTEVQKAKTTVDNILNPSAGARIKALQTLNILAEKKGKIDSKLEELVNFNAGNDGTLSKMEFSAQNGYEFTISNPKTIGKLLNFVQEELAELQANTDNQILNFQI